MTKLHSGSGGGVRWRAAQDREPSCVIASPERSRAACNRELCAIAACDRKLNAISLRQAGPVRARAERRSNTSDRSHSCPHTRFVHTRSRSPSLSAHSTMWMFAACACTSIVNLSRSPAISCISGAISKQKIFIFNSSSSITEVSDLSY